MCGIKVPLRDPVDDVHTLCYPSENRIPPVEVRLCRVRDEELRAAGVLTRVGNADHAPIVPVLVEFGSYEVTWISPTVATRTPTLDHEVGNDPVEGQILIET